MWFDSTPRVKIMDFKTKKMIFISALFLTGLSAGLFSGWLISVIPGMKALSSKNYLEAMQSINKAILNPIFFIIFFGPALLFCVSSIMQFKEGIDFSFWLLFGATIIYLSGTIGITIFGNVPLNKMLEIQPLHKLELEELEELRKSFEAPWNRFHIARTICTIISFILLLIINK